MSCMHFYMQCRWGHKEIVEYLVKNPNVDSNCSDSSGMTPLYRACRYAMATSTVHVNVTITFTLEQLWLQRHC